MDIRRKLLSALSISLLITACGGGGGTPPSSGEQTPPPPPPPVTPLTEVPVGSIPDGPIHAPLNVQEAPQRFYNVKIHPDGRLTGIAFLDASERYKLFSTGPTDFTSASLLTPEQTKESVFSFPTNSSVYIKEGILYNKNPNATTQLSGTEKVDHLWLSADQKHVLYIANTNYAYALSPITQVSTRYRRNELYTVDVQGGNRAKLSIADTNSKVIDDTFYYPDVIHSQRPQFLPDYSRVVYMVTSESTGLTELHSVLPDGTGRVVLNANLDITNNEGNNSFVFSFTDTSSHILYGVRNAGLMQLYSIQPDGTANTKINGNLVSGGSVYTARNGFSVATSPDNSYVVFLASAETVGINELYRVALDGSGLTKLSNGLNVSGNITTFVDNNTLVYFSDDLYAVSASGGTPTKLTNGFTVSQINNIQLSPDSTAVVYVAYDSVAKQRRLFVSKLDGSSTIDISGQMIAQGNVYSTGNSIPDFIFNPAGTRVTFNADADARYKRDLYSVNLDGSNRLKMTPASLHTGATFSTMFGYEGDKFYYAHDANTQGFTELYAYDFSNNTITNTSSNWPESITEDVVANQYLVQSTNGAVQAFVTEISAYREAAIIIRNPVSSCRINIPDDVSLQTDRANFLIEPTGNALYYTLYDDSNYWQFYRAETSDCSTTNIGSGISEVIDRMALSPDGLKMAFSGEDGGLYISANNGSNVIEVNATRSMGGIEGIGNVAFRISHDSKSIIYWGIEDTVDVVELYYASVDGSLHGKINGPLVIEGEVYKDNSNFVPVISPDDQWVIYPARQDALVWELYKSKLDGSANTRISDNLVNNQINVDDGEHLLRVTPDSSKVIYQVDNRTDGSTDLYSVNLTGSPAPVKLNPGFTERGSDLDARTIKLTPDSNAVVYMSRDSSIASKELFVVNLDGTSHTRLNRQLQANEKVISFSLTKDGSKVVYLTGFQNNELTGLHVSNIDGSAGSLLALSQPINGGSRQTPPRLTSDDRLVFNATLNTVDGVYIMPVSGGTPSLIVEIPTGRSLLEVYLINDGQIMIVADLRTPGVFEVFNYNI